MKPCLVCGEVSEGSRCPTHQAERDAQYGPAWRKLSKLKRAREPWCHCPGCPLHTGPCPNPPGHLDHIDPVAKGGLGTDANTRVLCPPCNWQKGADV